MRESLFRFWMGRWPRRLVATALILFACSSASLKAQTLSEGNFNYTNNGTNRTITGYTGGGVVVIPATIGGGAVTAIGNNAFQGKTNLTTVFIPNGVTTIRSYAFAACSMTAITLPNSLRSIEDHAFENNGNLTAVTIPEGVTTIGSTAFAGCREMELISLPNSLATIGDRVFQSCDKLNNVIIPGSVTSLGENAFQECSSLTSITLPSGLSKIESSTFWLCENLTTITIPSGVNEIESNAFLNCYKLASVYFLGNTRPTIGSDAFTNIVSVAKGYYPATASAPWSGITGLSLEPMLTFPETAFRGTFDGTSSTVRVIPLLARNDFSLAFWIKTAQAGTGPSGAEWWEGVGLLDGEVSGTTDDFGTSLMEGGKIGFGVGNPDTTLKSTKSVNNSVWHHVVVTRNASIISNGEVKIYVDGVLDSSRITGVTLPRNAPSRLTLGGLQTNMRYFQGEMADIRIYNREISAADVWLLAKRLSVSGSAPVTALLIDADADGLDDSVETNTGIYVSANNTGTDPSRADTDRDGVNDKLEVQYGTSPTVSTVFNRLINGSFEDGTVRPSPNGFLAVPQNDVPGWKTTAVNTTDPVDQYKIELWYSGFEGSFGNDRDILAELNYVASETLYQDVTMTVNSPVSYSFLHRGRAGNDEMVFKIDKLSGGPGTSVAETKFTLPVTTGTSWVRYSGSQATTVEAGKTYRFSYTSVKPINGTGNLLDDASFGIDQDGDGLLDYEELALGTNPNDADTDGDEFSDGVEVEAGSSPTSESSTPLPRIETYPVGATKEFGQSYRFDVLASGLGLTYQWKRDGQNVIGGSRPYLELASLTPSDSGSYTVTVSNSYGSVTSTAVYLFVNQALISSGFSHTLYLGAGATTVTAWGLNTDGRLGVGNMDSPVNWAKAVTGIPSGDTVTGLAAGGTHSLILAGGKVYAAGSDRFGQLGQGGTSRINQSSFIQVFAPTSRVVAVSAGGNHSLAVTQSGDVYACGDNTYGQLGNSTLVSSATWIKVSIQYPSTGLSPKIVSVVAGADHNLAVDEGGGVWVWGRNNYGQLGKGSRSVAERTPVQIISSGAKSAAAGFSHSLILTTDGKVRGFGRNNSGQTGQSATSSVVLVPAQISGLSEIRLISAGTDSSFAIDGEGQLRSWGYNAYGELLLGYASPAVYEPVPSQICDNVSVVSGGGYSSLAWGVQGLVFGGRNDVGQAGNGPDPYEVVGDYTYTGESLTLTNLTMDLAGTTPSLYDQIFVGSGAVTLNGIVNLMFVGTYTGPVYGTPQTFDLIWAKNGITLVTGYELAFNQAGYLVESAVADKIVGGVSGKVLQATVRAVESDLDSDKADALALAQASLDGLENDSYRVESNETIGVSQLSASPSRLVNRVEMIYSYTRPTGGVMSGAEYFVGGTTYRVQQGSSANGPWSNASVSGTTVTPLGKDSFGKEIERVTLRISSSGSAGFLRLEVAEEENNPQATPSN